MTNLNMARLQHSAVRALQVLIVIIAIYQSIFIKYSIVPLLIAAFGVNLYNKHAKTELTEKE